ncbi:hypothetical protein DMUE_2557 [Dictyocoela muelleri]|nr:hypothetical protein DMUE_2557 [Dictyocoela muelleri]
MFFLQIILYFITIKTECFIKVEDFEEIKENCQYLELLGEKLINSSEMLAYTINEYNINIENEYPELNSISKLYKDTIKDFKKLIRFIHTRISSQNHIFCSNFVDENQGSRILSEIENSNQQYRLIIQEIGKIDFEQYKNLSFNDVKSYFDFFTKNFYPNFLNLVKNIKIENNRMFYFDIDHFKKFYDLFNDFLNKTTNTLDIFLENGKYNGRFSTLRVIITEIKKANDLFFKPYVALYSFLHLKNNLCVFFNNETYNELQTRIIKLEYDINEIKNFNFRMNYPSKIKIMLECMDYQVNSLLLNLYILINNLDMPQYEDAYPSKTQISILKPIYDITFSNCWVFKKIIPMILGRFTSDSTLLDRLLNISGMNEDINNCLFMLCKDSNYMKIPKIYYEEKFKATVLYLKKIIEKISIISNLYHLKDPLKSDFNVIHKNLEIILRYLVQENAG